LCWCLIEWRCRLRLRVVREIKWCRVHGGTERGDSEMKEVIFSFFVWNTTQLNGNHVSPSFFPLLLLLWIYHLFLLLYNFFHLISFFGLESPTRLLAASRQSTGAHIQRPVRCLFTCSALKMKAEDSAKTFIPVSNTTMHHVSSHSALSEFPCRIWVTTDWKEVEASTHCMIWSTFLIYEESR
jgi:hypothetical protein